MGAVQSVVEDVGNAIVGVAEDVGRTVVDTAEDMGNAITDTAEDMGNAIADTAEIVGEGVVETAKDVSEEMEGITSRLLEGTGAVGRSVGDLFYPDNPRRRRRVDQLRTDIQTFQAQYEAARKQVLEQVNALQEQLDELMRQNGYHSFEELDQKIQGMADGTAVQQWNEFKTTLNKHIAAENLIMTSTGLLTIMTGVFAYGMALCGMITAATAGLAVKVVGIVALVLAAAIVIVAIIDAAEEADRLQEAIRELCFNRVDAKQALELMNINIGYVGQFATFLTNNYFIENPTEFDNYTMGLYREQLEKITREKIAADLKEYDRTREDGAWTNDDPDYSINPGGKTDKVRAMLDRANKTPATPALTAEVSESLSTLPAEVEAEAAALAKSVEPNSVPENMLNIDTGGVDINAVLESVLISDNDSATAIDNSADNAASDSTRGGPGRRGRGRAGFEGAGPPGGRGGRGSRGGGDRGRGFGGRGGNARGSHDIRQVTRGRSFADSGRGGGRGRGGGGGRGRRWRSPARQLQTLASQRRFTDRGKRIFERRLEDAEQPVVQFIHSRSADNDRVLKQQFKVLSFDSILSCTVADAVTNHQWKIQANLDGAPKVDVNIRNVRFTLTDETDKKVYKDCRILLRGRAATPA